MKVVIFHGWGCSSQDNWFPWLRAELENKGFKVHCPDLPNPEKPKQKEWLDAALKLTSYDEETVLVGHSLGTILIMRLLEQLDRKVRAAFLVAAFDEHLNIPELENFFEKGFDYGNIKDNAEKIVMLSSDNDPYIPIEISQRLSKNLGCKLIVFKNRGHLSSGTGDIMFPELREMIINC